MRLSQGFQLLFFSDAFTLDPSLASQLAKEWLLAVTPIFA
jgi:hypothetical protein